MNPILGALGLSRLSSQIQPIKQALAMVQNAGDPQAILRQIMAQNPQYGQVMKLISDSGGDAQKAFYSLANQMGIDPAQIINALK